MILKKKHGQPGARTAQTRRSSASPTATAWMTSACRTWRTSSRAPFALALAHKLAPGTAAAGSTAYHGESDGESDNGLTSPGGSGRARGRTATSPDPSENLSNDPISSRFKIGFRSQSGRGKSPAFREEGANQSATSSQCGNDGHRRLRALNKHWMTDEPNFYHMGFGDNC